VIATRNEGRLLAETVESVLNDSEYPDVEVVVVDDGSSDGSSDGLDADDRVRVLRLGGVGLAAARNAGAARARGDYIVFLDAHCRVSANWLDALTEALRPADVALAGPSITDLADPGRRACGMTWINRALETAWIDPSPDGRVCPVPFVPGGCQAYRARGFHDVGRFDEGMALWGFEDIEICLRAWLLGYRVVGAPAATVAHLFREQREFDVPDYGVLLNFLRLLHLHLSPWRIERAIDAIGDYPALARALREVAASDVIHRRGALDAVRVHEDDWFFAVFMPKLWGPHPREARAGVLNG
jgi:glycosyltransferase involved in cell wall biosynthesis